MLSGSALTVKCRRWQWDFLAIDFFASECACVFSVLARSVLEENFAAHHFDCVASDANVNYPVIATRRAHKNPARSLHLAALLDEDALLGFGYPVRHHPRRRASRCRPRSRILSVVEQHPGVQTGRRIDGFTRHEVQEFSARFLQIVDGAVQIDTQFLEKTGGKFLYFV